jgi:glycosyltransferase involved in cell wall biosynthesis
MATHRKIRVLQFPVRNTGGGVTKYALNNWRYIDKTRFVFDFATCDKKLDFADELVIQGCKVHYLSHYAEQDFDGFCKEFNRILDEGYDAVHLHTSFWKSFAVEELAMARGVPVVIVHSHNADLGGLPVDADRKTSLAVHNKRKSEFSESLATHFCACSRLAADWLFGSQIPRERIRILPNAIDVEKFVYNPGIRRQYRKELGIEDKFVIGHIGRFEYEKNHEFLLDVFAKVTKEVSNAVLLSVGTGDLFEDIKRKTDRLGVGDRILFLGKRDDVANLYQAMDLFALTSRFEGLAIVLIESQCTGLRTTTTTTTTMPENVITDNIIGLPFDAGIWRDEIARVARQGYERRDRREEVAKAGYSIKEQIRQIERIYEGEDG